MHLWRRVARVTPGAIAKWVTIESYKDATSATKQCKMHGGTQTAHAHRRVAVGARRWFFCQYYRRGLCVFRLRGLGRRGAAADFSRRRHPRGVKLYRLDGHPE